MQFSFSELFNRIKNVFTKIDEIKVLTLGNIKIDKQNFKFLWTIKKYIANKI